MMVVRAALRTGLNSEYLKLWPVNAVRSETGCFTEGALGTKRASTVST